MIPKIIHSCWFGGNPKSALLERCLASWKEHLPDFHLQEWNEVNFDVSSNRYVARAYAERKWAFVSDYVRLFVLREHGGVYLDTDVQIFRPFETFLQHKAFTGFENYKGLLAPITAVMGAIPNHSWIAELLAEYDNLEYAPRGGSLAAETNTNRITQNLVDRYKVRIDDSRQVIGDDVHIYPSSTFCNYTTASYAMHHFSGSWVPMRYRMRARMGDWARALRLR